MTQFPRLLHVSFSSACFLRFSCLLFCFCWGHFLVSISVGNVFEKTCRNISRIQVQKANKNIKKSESEGFTTIAVNNFAKTLIWTMSEIPWERDNFKRYQDLLGRVEWSQLFMLSCYLLFLSDYNYFSCLYGSSQKPWNIALLCSVHVYWTIYVAY